MSLGGTRDFSAMESKIVGQTELDFRQISNVMMKALEEEAARRNKASFGLGTADPMFRRWVVHLDK